MRSNYLSPLICGFGASVLTVIPGLKEIGCCLIIPFASALSLYLFQKANNSTELVSVKQAITFGLLTGIFYALFAAIFETLFTALFFTNDFVKSLPQVQETMQSFASKDILDSVFNIYNKMAEDIQTKGFSFTYTVYFFLATSFTGVIFGLIGGLVGMAFINKRNRNITN